MLECLQKHIINLFINCHNQPRTEVINAVFFLMLVNILLLIYKSFDLSYYKKKMQNFIFKMLVKISKREDELQKGLDDISGMVSQMKNPEIL